MSQSNTVRITQCITRPLSAIYQAPTGCFVHRISCDTAGDVVAARRYGAGAPPFAQRISPNNLFLAQRIQFIYSTTEFIHANR